MRRVIVGLAVLVGACVVFLTGGSYQSASASVIFIANHSFEDERVDDLALYPNLYNDSIQDWTQDAASAANPHGWGIGTWACWPVDQSTLDGTQSAYLNGGRIAQQLTTGLVLGERYRLSALFGAVGDITGGVLELWAGGTAALGDVSDGVLLGSLTVNNTDLVRGKFIPFQTEIEAPLSGLLGGELLSIRFVSNGRESEIDNIHLSTVNAVPESSSLSVWSFLSMAAIGCCYWRKRRQ